MQGLANGFLKINPNRVRVVFVIAYVGEVVISS